MAFDACVQQEALSQSRQDEESQASVHKEQESADSTSSELTDPTRRKRRATKVPWYVT